MADLRLLTLWLFVAASGCAFGPIWAPTLEGTITHQWTGEPVVGAMVVSYYGTGGYSLGGRCTRTNAGGRFVIPGHFAVYPHFITASVDGPNVLAFHREFASGAWNDSESFQRTGEWVDRRELRFRMEQPTDPDWKARRTPRWWETACFTFANKAGDVREDYEMHQSCESIVVAECPGILR
jgi:hypothetical protein